MITTFAAAVAQILSYASVASDAFEHSESFQGEDPFDFGVQVAISVAARADARTGEFRFETPSEDIASALFVGTVAHQIKDGTYSVPSLGNIRAAAERTFAITTSHPHEYTEADVLGTVAAYDLNA